MARKSKKKTAQPASSAIDEYMTEDESINEEMNEIVNGEIESERKGTNNSDDGESGKEGEDKSTDTKSKHNSSNNKSTASTIPFMDTFYLLSSEDSSKDRSIAARDLIHHCFFSDGGINSKDSAYALNRLLNGIYSGRAASRQGFASCLTSFLRVGQSQGGDALKSILKEHSELKQTDLDDAHPAIQIRQMLRTATDISTVESSSGKKSGTKKNRFAGKMKGIEERDHVFGRLFGILAVVRSGILKSTPDEVLKGYVEDLIELYHYKKWMREPSVHALIELVSSLDKKKQISSLTNDFITPKLIFLQEQKDRTAWLEQLTAEQIALGVHLQQVEGAKYAYPLDQPLLTKANAIQSVSSALASTSSAVYPRCHVVWNVVWMCLTEESDGQRILKAGKEYTKAINDIIQYVVVEKLLGKQDGAAAPTHERRSLALQIVCTLCASCDLEIVIPTTLIESVLCKEVVNTIFLNVLCASSGSGKRKINADGAATIEPHLKPLTTSLLNELVNRCCECGDVDRQVAFAKAFLSADPRFDVKTKTNSVGSISMMYGVDKKLDEGEMKQRKKLWEKYLSFLEEKIVSADSLHGATSYIELMYKLAKCDLTQAPADEARRVVRFFMSAAFYDCSNLSSPSSSKKKKSTKKSHIAELPQELSSALRINELLKSHNLSSISHAARKIMSARFYSLLSDFISVLNAQGRQKNETEFYGKVNRPETIYRALSEICGISSLLESSGAKKFSSKEVDERDDQMEESRKSLLKVQAIANEALVKECDGKGDAESLRAKSVFATSCASLMMSLYLQLSCCGNPDTSDNEADEDDEEDSTEALHEFIADLADVVTSFCALMEGHAKGEDGEEDENPLAAAAGLLVNILSSPVGGDDADRTNAVQASASKLTRETVKLMWSGIIAAMNALHEKQELVKTLLNEDVMTTLIESVCGEDANGADQKDDESIDESDASSDGEEDDSKVFIKANKMEVDLDEVENTNSKGSDDEEAGAAETDDDSVELDPSQLENMLLEDSDAEMSDSGPHGVLEHHAGADKALAQLIKLKQEARKASQTERERVELCNRLRCATLLESLFSPSVFKNGWIPIEAILGSMVPILRYRKALAKSIQSSASSGHSKKALIEKNVILDKLSMLLKDRVSKYRCSSKDSDASEVAMKASTEIYEEMKHSLTSADCSCCSIALITSVRCIPNSEENEDVKEIYASLINDWATRKASKIHLCVFDDLIKRMPSLASIALITPLSEASRTGHSAFIKCESVRLLAAIFHGCSADETLSDKARSLLKESSGNVAKSFSDALADSSLQKAKHRDEVMHAAKHFVNFLKAQKDGVLTESELSTLRESLAKAGDKCNSKGMKQMCKQVCASISDVVPRRTDDKDKTAKRSNTAKTPKSTKKRKTKK